MHDPLLHIAGLEPLGEEVFAWTRTQGGEQRGMRQIVKCSTNVYADHPRPACRGASETIDLFDGILTTAARSESVATPLEPSLPKGFEDIFDLGLETPVKNARNS